jgi:hypothetical protein
MGDAETYFLLARRNDVRHALPTIDATADLE